MVYEELVYQPIAESLGVSVESAAVIFVIILVWSTVWMAIAMWKAARKNHLVWFIAFLIIHTFGILEILYLLVFSEMGSKNTKVVKKAEVKKKKSRKK